MSYILKQNKDKTSWDIQLSILSGITIAVTNDRKLDVLQSFDIKINFI